MKTAIGYCYRELSPSVFLTNMIRVYDSVPEIREGGVLAIPFRHNLAESRNQLVQALLESDRDRILMVDTDVMFTPMDVQAILASDADVTAGAYMNSLEKLDALDLDRNPITSLPERPEPMSVACAGTGFMLIHRRVFEKYPGRDWFNYLRVEGVQLEKELAFFFRIRESGFEIILDPSIILGHLKMTNISPYGLGL